jgi:hypothetical protein
MPKIGDQKMSLHGDRSRSYGETRIFSFYRALAGRKLLRERVRAHVMQVCQSHRIL